MSDRKRRLELCRSQLGNGSEVMHHIPWLCVPNRLHASFFLHHDVPICAWKGIVYGGQQEFSECTRTYRIQIWAYSYCSNVHFRTITSIYQPTNAHIISNKTLSKHFKTLRHVSILSDHHQGALFLLKLYYILVFKLSPRSKCNLLLFG